MRWARSSVSSSPATRWWTGAPASAEIAAAVRTRAVGIGGVAAEQAVESGEEIFVAGVVGHQADHDRIEPELAEHAARLDGEGDEARDEAVERALA